MIEPDPRDPRKEICNELAELLSNGGARALRLLQLSGTMAPVAGPARPAVASNTEAVPAKHRPISIWQPREIDGEVQFVRPDPPILGDDHSARRVYRRKKPGTRRICLVGESVAAGFLYAPDLCLAAVIEQQLRTLHGKDSFDLIDFSRTGEKLRPLLMTLKAALQLEPDLVVFMIGNNWNLLETLYISPYVPSLQARQQYAQEMRRSGLRGPIEMARQILRNGVPKTLARIGEIARGAGIPVICVIPEVNRADWENLQPVAWLPGDGTARWHALYERAVRSLDQKAFDEAIRAATEMIDLDGGTCPTPHRILCEAHVGLGDLEKASDASVAEVDSTHYANLCHMCGPQVTTLARDLLHEGAAKNRFTEIDLRPVFKAHTGSPLPGRRMFLDYCHLTSEGMKVAAAAIVAEVGRLTISSRLTWQQVLEKVPDPEIAPEAEGIARLGAAIHNAHRGLQIRAKASLLEHWCEQALAAAPEAVAESMIGFLEARSAPCPAVLTQALQRAIASTSHLRMQHGWQHDHLDVEMIHAILSVLEQAGRPVRAWLESLLLTHHAIRPEGTELATPPFYHWQPVARFYPDFLSFRDVTGRATYRSAWPRSDFCFVCTARDVELRITARLPAGAANGRNQGQVDVAVNEDAVGSLCFAERWTRRVLRVPQAHVRTGINRLTLRWPALATPGEGPIEKAIRRLEEGAEADLHPVFGEIFALVARPV